MAARRIERRPGLRIAAGRSEYEQQPGVGLAVRKYVLQKRGAIASDAQRSPATPLTAEAKSEVDFLLDRLARLDARAAPRSRAA